MNMQDLCEKCEKHAITWKELQYCEYCSIDHAERVTEQRSQVHSTYPRDAEEYRIAKGRI